MSENSQISTVCPICGENAEMTCAGCRNVKYCSKAHQKEDWNKGHKQRCKAYKIANDAIIGRHLIATRDIAAGEIIFTESPLICGPKITSLPVCLGCLELLPPPQPPATNYYKCRKCGWPLCGPACETAPAHREECEIMSARGFRARIDYKTQPTQESCYCVILPMRCMLMRQRDPLTYEKLLTLQDHLQERIDTPLYRILRVNLLSFLQTVLGFREFDDNAILRLAAIFDTNAFELRAANGAKLRAIYPLAAMISHECVANARHTFDAERRIVFFAKVKIHKGEIISTSYTQPLKNTLQRRAHLWNAKCFYCTCKRCADGTELQTFAGSILCCRCKIGKLVCEEPLNNDADWKCQLCPHKLKAEQIQHGNESIRNNIANLNKTSPEDFEEFLKRYADLLHPTNSYALEVKYALTQLYGTAPGYKLAALDIETLKRKLELCEELLEIADIFDPGLSIFRGLLLHDFYEGTVAYAHAQRTAGLWTQSEVEKQIAAAAMTTKDVDRILKIDGEFEKMLEKRQQATQ